LSSVDYHYTLAPLGQCEKDEVSRRVSEPSAGPLFASESEADDLASGTIYVLQQVG
jgi:hypothetical protein